VRSGSKSPAAVSLGRRDSINQKIPPSGYGGKYRHSDEGHDFSPSPELLDNHKIKHNNMQ